MAEADAAASSHITHTGCGKCPAWCSECRLLHAKCELMCLCCVQERAGYSPGSRQGSRLRRPHQEKREGSNTVCPAWPVECTGQKKVLPSKLSENTLFMSNWRGLGSCLDSPGPVTGRLWLPFPLTRAATAAARQSQDGGTGMPLPFCPSFTGRVGLWLEFMAQI